MISSETEDQHFTNDLLVTNNEQEEETNNHVNNNNGLFNLIVRPATNKDLVKASIESREVLNPTDKKDFSIDLKDLDEKTLQELIQQLYKDNNNQQEPEEMVWFQRESSLKRPEYGFTNTLQKVTFPPIENQQDLEKDVKEQALTFLKEEIKNNIGPLEIIRTIPDNETNQKNTSNTSFPYFVILFNQEMIETFDPNPLPFDSINFIEITPKTENIKNGKWKWVGTKTLIFEPELRRFDFSTEFKIKILENCTKSIHDKVLEKTKEITFRTRTISLNYNYPNNNNTYPLNKIPFAYLEFDQRMDPREVIKFIEVKEVQGFFTIGDCKQYNVELVTDLSLIEKKLDGSNLESKFNSLYLGYKNLLKKSNTDKSFWIYIHSIKGNVDNLENSELFASGERIAVTILQGTPSLEGPLVSEKERSIYLSNYGPLKLSYHYPTKFLMFKLNPGGDFFFYFTNPIDLEHFKPEFVKIEPEIKACDVLVNGSRITIKGDMKARTKYEVTISKELTDIYGQKLESDCSKTFDLGGRSKSFYCSLAQNLPILSPTLFPNRKPRFEFTTVNYLDLHVVICEATKEDYIKYVIKNDYNETKKEYNYWRWYGNSPKEIGKKVFDKSVQVENYTKDESILTSLDLSPFLKDEKYGLLLISVKPKSFLHSVFGEYSYYWVQCSDLSIEIFNTNENSLFDVYVNNIATGKPEEGVDFYLGSKYNHEEKEEIVKKTNGSGVTTVEIQSQTSYGYGNAKYAIATKGDDVLILPDLNLPYGSKPIRYLFHVLSDRKLYKPKEKIHFKGFIREVHYQDNSKLKGTNKLVIPEDNTNFTYYLKDGYGIEYKKGNVSLSGDGYGSFAIEEEIPDNVNLGHHQLFIYYKNQASVTVFDVQEFRKPEFNVNSSAVQSDPHFIGDSIVYKTNANYYSGGALNRATVNYVVSSQLSSYTPPNWSRYSFTENYFKTDPNKSNFYLTRTLSSNINSSGEDHIVIQTMDQNNTCKAPVTITCKANIQDLNYQTQGTDNSLLLHPSKYYVGIKSNKSTLSGSDEGITLSFIVTDIDGKVIPNVNIKCSVIKLASCRVGQSYEQKSIPVTDFTIDSSTGPKEYFVPITDNTYYTRYYAIAEISEGKRKNYSSISFSKTGIVNNPSTESNLHGLQKYNIELMSDKGEDEYVNGDVATIFVPSPFTNDCTGFYRIVCAGTIETKQFTLEAKKGFYELQVPIKKEYRPNIDIHVHLFGTTKEFDEITENDIDLPSYASGRISLKISIEHHKLDVVVIPKQSMTTPGKETSVNVIVTDKQGRNRENTEVCLVVVDEAILSMAGYKIADPISTFIENNYALLFEATSRSLEMHGFKLRPKKLDIISVIQKDLDNVRDIMNQNIDLLLDQSESLGGIERGKCELKECEQFQKKKGGGLFSIPTIGGTSRSLSSSNSSRLRRKESARVKNESKFHLDTFMQEENLSKDEFTVRKEFRPDAAFITLVKTNQSGEVTIPFKLTDSLSRFRVTAIAVTNNELYGVGETVITTTLPISVRPSLPRFLNYGDSCDLSYTIQNQTNYALTLSIVWYLENNLRIFGDDNKKEKGYYLTIPASERAEIKLPIQVYQCGKANIKVGIRIINTEPLEEKIIGWSDAVNNEIPIFTPATTEAFASYGELNEYSDNYKFEDKEYLLQPVALPNKSIVPHLGNFTISTSSTALASLTDSILYLYNSEYESNEHISSRLLTLISLQDIILQFNTEEELKKTMNINGKTDIDDNINKGIKKLSENQRYNGSWGYWETNKGWADPFITCHVALCLFKCKKAGYEVQNEVLRRASNILGNIESLIPLIFRLLIPKVFKDELRAFAAFVLSEYANTKEDHTRIENLLSKILSSYKDVNSLNKEISIDGLAYLTIAMYRYNEFMKKSKEIDEEKNSKENNSGFFGKLFGNQKKTDSNSESPPVFIKHINLDQWIKDCIYYFSQNITYDSGEHVHFITNYNETSKVILLQSETKTDAIVLNCLLEIDLENSKDIIVKLTKGLISSRNRYGRWRNTQENLHVLLALNKYFITFEKDVPDFTIDKWFGELYLGKEEWKGRSKEKRSVEIPLTAFFKVDNNEKIAEKKDILLVKEGKGCCYYRMTMNYTPTSLNLPSLDAGFTLIRRYEPVTDKSHVQFNEKINTWQIKSGQLVRVKISITTMSRKYHVALVDKLPAGLEVVNPELDTQVVIDNVNQEQDNYGGWYNFNWFEHQNLRDERVEAFASVLYEGIYEYSYICRATTSGSYVSPPAKVEEMYAPEIFGRSGTDFVQIL
ncbi:hypothetical protein ABK040_013894 [Willaertia magna]